jgi:hypothetical protein
MVRDRKIIVLSILLGVLVVAYILGTIFTRSDRQQRVHSIPVLTPLEREAVSSFLIERGGETLSMRLGDDGSWWIVTDEGNLPVSEDKVDRFLETLMNSRTLRYATDDEEFFEDFSVEHPRRYIQFFDEGGELVKRLVLSEPEAEAGNAPAAETGPLYVRMQPAEKIYQVEDELYFYLRQARNYWADLDLFPPAVGPDTLVRADIDGSFVLSDGYEFEGTYTLVRLIESDEELWEILPAVTDGDGPGDGNGGSDPIADPSAIEGVITSLAELRAFGFADNGSRSGKGVDNPSGSIRFQTEDGSEHRLVLGDPADEEESRYLEVSGEPYVYVIKEWAVKRIFKHREELERESEG